MLVSADESRQLSEVVISVVTAHLETEHLQKIVDEVTDVLRGESADMPGFIAGHVLVSLDERTLTIVTEWRDSHLWSQSRYDTRVGQMLEHCLINSSALDFELYQRKAHFVVAEAPAPDAKP